MIISRLVRAVIAEYDTSSPTVASPESVCVLLLIKYSVLSNPDFVRYKFTKES